GAAMIEDDAFLQAIIENPDDDSRRLKYADWLEDWGETERADFIRVQCKLARLPQDDPQSPGLVAREQAFLKRHQDEWLGPLQGIVADDVFDPEYRFRRGFVEEVTLPTAGFLARGEEL